MRQAIIWANADQVHWRIYVALGGEELFMNMACQTIPIDEPCFPLLHKNKDMFVYVLHPIMFM